jgi:L-ascorbate metabolism protein UlaG (beta-lactamase superfamily)
VTDPAFCLSPDTVVEPLVARWHASTHLISPATAALNAADRHIKTMESYVAMPQVHAAAARDPALLGGPFIDIGGGRVEEIRALLDWTRARQQPALVLAESLNACWKLLAREADGHGMAPLYERLPEALRGAVELVYTPAGAPDLRVNEAILYRSPCYDPTLQGVMIRRIAGDERPFALSTPRLDEPGSLYLEIPFADPAYDLLGSLRRKPRPLSEIAAALRVGPDRLPLLESFLTERVPPTRPDNKVTRWRYFGHACVLVETAGGQTVLVDPVIAYESGGASARFTAADLPERIDYVVLTHNHLDHALLETLLALRWKVGTVLVPAGGGSLVDPSLRLALKAIGFADVRELACLEELVDGELRITALPFLGEHADLDIRTKAAWLVEAENLRLMLAADSNNIDPRLYERLRPLIGRLDTLFLGMECKGAPMSWIYGCLLPVAPSRDKDQSRRLDGSDSARALAAIRSLEVGRVCIYAMGLEPWLKFISSLVPDPDSAPMRESEKLIAQCRALGIPAERLYGRAEVAART